MVYESLSSSVLNGSSSSSLTDSDHRSCDDHFPIYVVSTSTCYNAEQRVHIVLAQFPGNQIPVVRHPKVCSVEKVDEIVELAKTTNATIVHTLEISALRRHLVTQCHEGGLMEFDLTGPLVDRLSQLLGRDPADEPGRYRREHQAEFDRLCAIEYTLAHDDGRRPHEWPLADIILLGPSRAGKTPLSTYLGALGWKVANLPLIPGMELPAALNQVDPRRVIGLVVPPSVLQAHRESRHLGIEHANYLDPLIIIEELREARRLYLRHGFSVVEVVDRAVESCADEIISKVKGLPRRLSFGSMIGLAALNSA